MSLRSRGSRASLRLASAVSSGWKFIEGARDRSAQRQALNLLKRFETLELTPEDTVWATEKLIAFNLSHNIDSFDCLIAAVNYRLQIPLYTANLKHFQPILGDLCRRPY
jgi:predicted nucleic acid-binding protein